MPCKRVTDDSSIVEFKPLQQDISESLQNQHFINERQSLSMKGYLEVALQNVSEARKMSKEFHDDFDVKPNQMRM